MYLYDFIIFLAPSVIDYANESLIIIHEIYLSEILVEAHCFHVTYIKISYENRHYDIAYRQRQKERDGEREEQ